MSYQIGGLIQASDINNWLGTILALWGTGTGSIGYGQSLPTSGVNAGGIISAAHWQHLRNMMAAIATHQNVSATNLVPTSLIEGGDTIYAHVSGTGNNAYDIANLVNTLYANRLGGVNGLVYTSGAYSLTKSTAWSASTACSFDVTFSSEDHARFFFNTGGSIVIRLVATDTLASSGAAQDAQWRDILSTKVGSFQFRAADASRSGTGGVVANGGAGGLGFYGLNGTDTSIYGGVNIGSGAYASNDVYINAHVRNVAGVNGGNGTVVRFTVTLADEHTNGFYDSVAAGAQLVVDVSKVNTSVLTNAIAAPTISTVTGWS